MYDLTKLAAIMAAVLRETGGDKWAKAQHEAVMAAIVAANWTREEERAAFLRLGNVSAVKQELETAGVLPPPKKQASALGTAVLKALETQG